ncbi:hypothetical protein L596_006933 [Steinernema carpocapsae]|uniref:glutathione transferase n=1 Tax=Steinernema carpocapsae TaxID=34508 RepID=A0A4U5P7H6_STECR|nr:hypothetical protein L596_006933 [Steinernema carpocapsae]
MTVYKLHYFENVGGRAELIRLLFAYGGIEFEEISLNFSDWPKLKANYPNGQVPVLEKDGKILPQSIAIARLVARKANLLGEGDWEMAQADAFVDTAVDVITEMKTRGINVKIREGKGSEIAEELGQALKPYFERIEKHLKTTNGVNLVGDHLTWADFALADLFKRYSITATSVLEEFSAVKKFVDHFHELPQIKKYVAKRTLKFL